MVSRPPNHLATSAWETDCSGLKDPRQGSALPSEPVSGCEIASLMALLKLSGRVCTKDLHTVYAQTPPLHPVRRLFPKQLPPRCQGLCWLLRVGLVPTLTGLCPHSVTVPSGGAGSHPPWERQCEGWRSPAEGTVSGSVSWGGGAGAWLVPEGGVKPAEEARTSSQAGSKQKNPFTTQWAP